MFRRKAQLAAAALFAALLLDTGMVAGAQVVASTIPAQGAGQNAQAPQANDKAVDDAWQRQRAKPKSKLDPAC